MTWKKGREKTRKERVEKHIERVLERIPKDVGRGPFYVNRAMRRGK